MSISSAILPDPDEGAPWAAGEGPVVVHYSTSSHTRFSRPVSDWVALFTTGVIVNVALYLLLFAMATHPIT